MKKNITTKYSLQSVSGSRVETILSSCFKEEIVELYSISCENFPRNHYQILKTETFCEVIAQSNDERQTLLLLE